MVDCLKCRTNSLKQPWLCHLPWRGLWGFIFFCKPSHPSDKNLAFETNLYGFQSKLSVHLMQIQATLALETNCGHIYCGNCILEVTSQIQERDKDINQYVWSPYICHPIYIFILSMLLLSILIVFWNTDNEYQRERERERGYQRKVLLVDLLVGLSLRLWGRKFSQKIVHHIILLYSGLAA